MQQKRRSGYGTMCGDVRSGLENTNQAAGSEREIEEEKEQCEVLAHQEEQNLPEKLHEERGEEAVENLLGPRKSVDRASRGYCAHREVKIEEADGGSTRARRNRFRFPCSWR